MPIMTKEEYEIIQKHPHRVRITAFGGGVLFDGVLPLKDAWPKIKEALQRGRIKKHYSVSLMPQ